VAAIALEAAPWIQKSDFLQKKVQKGELKVRQKAAYSAQNRVTNSRNH